MTGGREGRRNKGMGEGMERWMDERRDGMVGSGWRNGGMERLKEE